MFSGVLFVVETDDAGDVARCRGLLWVCVAFVGGHILTTLVLSTIEGMGCVADTTPGIDVLVSFVMIAPDGSMFHPLVDSRRNFR